MQKLLLPIILGLFIAGQTVFGQYCETATINFQSTYGLMTAPSGNPGSGPTSVRQINSFSVTFGSTQSLTGSNYTAFVPKDHFTFNAGTNTLGIAYHYTICYYGGGSWANPNPAGQDATETIFIQKTPPASTLTLSNVTFCSNGSTVTLTGGTPGLNIKIKGYDDRDYGNYIVTSVNHRYNVGGNYQNSFSAVPSDVKATPYTNPALTPRCEAQTGVVDDNKDPNGLGRVKVRLYWQNNTVTPWLRIAMPYTGGSKGVYFVPEKGEEVMVGFEGGNAEQPFVIGSLYHGKADPGDFTNEQNNIKAIKTRSEHIIEFNDDENGSWGITIKDKNGNMIRLDTKGKNIDIIAPETMTLRSKNMVIKVDEHLTIDASNKDETIQQKSNLTISDDFTVKVGNWKETVNENKEEKIQDTYKLTVKEANIKSTSGDFRIKSAGVAVFQGSKDVKISKG